MIMSWQEEKIGEGKTGLIQTFEFADFKEAWSFMNQVAELAEEHQHHPNWTNVYNRVTIMLSTHDAGDVVTAKDKKLAEAIDALLG